MQEGGEQIAALIGARLRAGRTANGWTLDEMAERSGVSRRMVVKVEQGAVNPSVSTVLRLGDTLGIGLPTLVGPTETGSPALTRAGTGATLWSSPAGGSGVLLSGTSTPDVLALWEWALMPGDAHSSDAHMPGTREILHVTSGQVRLRVGEQITELDVGDTFTFAGDQQHIYANTGDAPARFSLVVSKSFADTSTNHATGRTPSR